MKVSIWYIRSQLSVLDSFGQFWTVKGGFEPSLGHYPAQNRN